MREICTSGSEGGAGQTNAPSLPLSNGRYGVRELACNDVAKRRRDPALPVLSGVEGGKGS